MSTHWVLGISIVLQFIAAGLALWLIRITGRQWAWLAIAVALTLMGVRRCITFYGIVFEDMPHTHTADISAELVAITISALMVIGVASIAPMFLTFKRSGKALSRAGLFWAPQSQSLKDHNFFFFVKVFPYESDGRGYQVSFAWNKKFPDILDGRFSIGGFFDANFENGPGKDKVLIVSDTQFRYRLVDGLHFLAEARVNKFFGAKKDVDVGFGLQYHF